MRLVYLGAEVPSNRGILEEAGVTYVGFSFWRAYKRGLPKTKQYLLSEHFPDSMKIIVYSGAPKDEEIPDDYQDLYIKFLDSNIDRIEFVYNEATPLSPGWSDKTIHVWDAATGKVGLEYLVDHGATHIGIRGEDIETNYFLAASTQALHTEGARFHAIGSAKPDNLRQVKIETASTMSWLSPMMRGETIVWDGSRIVRYPKRMREQARPRYTHIYEKAGLDFDKIMADDSREVTKLALWTYSQYEKRANMSNIYDRSDESQGGDIVETPQSDVDMLGGPVRKVFARSESEMGLLPVFDYEISSIVEQDEEGRDVIKDVPVVKSQSGSLRLCDTCFVASNCPAFKPKSNCAFKLPVEVKTKDQLKALINAIIEMQGQRVAFARFTEEINGGYPDPNVSQEIDRLFKLIKTTKDLDDSQSFIRMTVESKASSGVLSALFGDKAASLRDLPNNGLTEDQTTRIIQGEIEN
jgi:hypothetical protein